LMSSELCTHKTVKARFWLWLSGKLFRSFHHRSEAAITHSFLRPTAFAGGHTKGIQTPMARAPFT
jgi:hypothetical protein